jgi:hypothetical protein
VNAICKLSYRNDAPCDACLLDDAAVAEFSIADEISVDLCSSCAKKISAFIEQTSAIIEGEPKASRRRG